MFDAFGVAAWLFDVFGAATALDTFEVGGGACGVVLGTGVGVGDGDIWFGQCVNVLLLLAACKRSTFSLVHTLRR